MRMRSKVNVLLAERRMTKRELERRLGISHSTAWHWTTDEGIGTLPITKLQRLADAIGCEVSDLYER
jgi:DNA-binding Xre family transcriptional regulator